MKIYFLGIFEIDINFIDLALASWGYSIVITCSWLGYVLLLSRVFSIFLKWK